MGNGTLTTVEQKSGGIADLTGSMSGEMALRLQEMKSKLELVRNFMNQVMVKNFDYGVITGTGNKPILLKPGAEKLCELYGFTHLIKDKRTERDLETGYFLAEVVVQIVHRQTGLVIAEGVGECSSFESKYRYRWFLESEIKKLQVDPKGLVSKDFVRADKTEYTKYRMDNTDLVDQWNTVLKMAKKRALVDAVLAATRSSELFSRSQNDFDAWLEEGEVPKPDRMEKKKSGPQEGDEKATAFNPSVGSLISDPQRKRIYYDAEVKGLAAAQIDAIIKHNKNKLVPELSKKEASAIIDWLGKVTKDEINDVLIDVEMDGASK